MMMVNILIRIVGGPLAGFALCLLCFCVAMAMGRCGRGGVALWVPVLTMSLVGALAAWVGSLALLVCAVVAWAGGLRFGSWLGSWGRTF
jgi:hypothetical protein